MALVAFFFILALIFPPLPRIFLTEANYAQVSIVFFVLFLFLVLHLRKIKVLTFSEKVVVYSNLYIAAFGLVSGVVYGYSAFSVLKEFLFWLAPFLVLFLLNDVLRKKDVEVAFSKAIVAYGIFAAVAQIVAMFFIGEQKTRYLDRWMHLLISSELIPVALTIILVKLKDKQRLRNYSILAIMLGGLLATRGRLELLFGLFVLGLVLTHNRGVFRYFPVFLVILAPPFYMYFLVLNGSLVVDNSLGWRQIEWLSYFASGWSDSIIFGNGFGASLETIVALDVYGGRTYTEIDRFHNLFLYLLFKVGILGLVIFLTSILWFIFHRLSKVKKDLEFYFISIFAFFIFVGGSFFGLHTMNVSSALILGIALYYARVNVRG